LPAEETEGRVLRKVAIVIPSGKEPERLDVFLARQVREITRSQVELAIAEGRVTIDGRPSKPSHKVKPGERIDLAFLARPPLELTPEPIPLQVVYEDDYLVVIDKPAGMIVHPAKGNRSGTLVNALLAHYGEVEPAADDDPDRPGIVHRIDKETSGLLVVCKREPAMSRLAKQFREHTVEREYWALAWWPFSHSKGTIDRPIGRDPTDRLKYAVAKPDASGRVKDSAKEARTHWTQIERFPFLTLLALRLETGRTHQIRVHLSDVGHPVFGDPDYCGRNRQMGRLSTAARSEAADYLEIARRQLLHARLLGFEHPVTGERLRFESPLPDDFQTVLDRLREKNQTRAR